MSPWTSKDELDGTAPHPSAHYLETMDRAANADDPSPLSPLPTPIEAVATLRSHEPDDRQGSDLAKALTGIAGQLATLGSAVTGLRGEVAALRRDMIEQSGSQAEKTSADTRETVRQAADLMVEMQLLSAIEMDAGLDRLGLRLETALRQSLDEKLSERLGQRFAELTSQLTEAIGVAMADRDLFAQITDPADGMDIERAMSILGIEGATRPGQMPIRAPAKRDVWFVKGYSDRTALACRLDPGPPRSSRAGTRRVASRRGLPAWLDRPGMAAGRNLAGKRRSRQDGRPLPSARLRRPHDLLPARRPDRGRDRDDRAHGLAGRHPASPDRDWICRRSRLRAERRQNPCPCLRSVPDAAAKALRSDARCSGRSLVSTSRLSVRRLAADSYRQEVAAHVREPVVASLASIPSRREMLRDSVASLLLQCDRVRVFLNGYADIPDFLSHPRIEVRRSQDWDDRGDAGKFFWIDKDRGEGGYRVIADDDLIFPPDFVEVLTGKVAAAGKRAIVSMHGILLRQPMGRFHDRSSRAATFHFNNPLSEDRRVHIGGTGVMCFHASAVDMGWHDFKYCNSGDVWIALYAQSHGLPIITPARPRNWIVENQRAGSHATIYDQSLNRTRSRFDSSRIQDAVLSRAWPLTVKTNDRPKVAVAIAISTAEGARDAVEHWLEVAAASVVTQDLIVVLAHDGADSEVVTAIAGLSIAHETHLLDVAKLEKGLGAALDDLRQRLGIDAMLAVQEQVRANVLAPHGDGSAEPEADMMLVRLPDAGGRAGWAAPDRDTLLAFAHCSGEPGEGALTQLLGGTQLLATHADVSRSFGTSRAAPREVEAKQPKPGRRQRKLVTLNDVFQRVVVMNLDRRPDRWTKASKQLKSAGIVAERFSAIDGSLPAIAEEYAAYAASPPHQVSPELPQIAYSQDLYMNYPSQMARIAHIEAESGRKAVASAGAWGYLRSYETLIERSLDAQDETLMVFDDDVVFHRDFKRLFAEAAAQLPDDWLIVQLGTLQYNWSDPWVRWRTPMLYQTNGSAIGSHAVGMRFDAMPFLLDHIRRMDLPYDTGALSAATRAFPDRCFVIYPNLAIQSLDGSDIGTSRFQKERTTKDIAAAYRWHLDDYAFSPRPGRSGRR